jgi:integrase
MRKFRTLQHKLERYFADVTSFDGLDSLRKWKELQLKEKRNLSASSLRIFVQDVNTILGLLANDGKIQMIRLTPPPRQHASSEGFNIEQLLHFTFADVQQLWLSIQGSTEQELTLLFALIICSGCHPSHLIHLRVGCVEKRTITIQSGGLIQSVLLEPARTRLYKFVLTMKLTAEDGVFMPNCYKRFVACLKSQCSMLGVPNITPSQLMYFSRFLMVRNGVPAYVVASMGKRNSFSPLGEDNFELIKDISQLVIGENKC